MGAYLLMLLLFFLLPNKPCMKMIGGAFGLVFESLGGSWRSYAIVMPLGSLVLLKARALLGEYVSRYVFKA